MSTRRLPSVPFFFRYLVLPQLGNRLPETERCPTLRPTPSQTARRTNSASQNVAQRLPSVPNSWRGQGGKECGRVESKQPFAFCGSPNVDDRTFFFAFFFFLSLFFFFFFIFFFFCSFRSSFHFSDSLFAHPTPPSLPSLFASRSGRRQWNRMQKWAKKNAKIANQRENHTQKKENRGAAVDLHIELVSPCSSS